MPKPAIIVEGLSKQYHIGARLNGRKTFREALTEVAAAPFRRLRAFGRSSHREEDTIWALKDVSFEVQPGEVVGIIGRNGAGKSTLLKVLTRITEPTEGRAVLNGRVSSLLEVGTGFHSELTGRENIYLSGAILGMKKREIDSKFDEIVDFSGVEKFIDTPVKRYSSGMTVRLGFAVAAHLEPEILLVDEVLAVGDAEFQQKCLGKMGEVATSGRTVLFVSHNMGAVRQLTRTSILLCDGHVLRVAPTSEVVDLYVGTLCHDGATVYEVEGAPRQFPGLRRDVEFISLELESGPSKTFSSGSEIPFLARVRGNRNVQRFRISLTIFRSDGTPVGSLFTPESLSVHDREVAVFRVALRDLRLASGRYYVALAVGTGSPQTGLTEFDVVLDVLHCEVLPPLGTEGGRSLWPAGWGAIMFDQCSVTRVG